MPDFDEYLPITSIDEDPQVQDENEITHEQIIAERKLLHLVHFKTSAYMINSLFDSIEGLGIQDPIWKRLLEEIISKYGLVGLTLVSNEIVGESTKRKVKDLLIFLKSKMVDLVIDRKITIDSTQEEVVSVLTNEDAPVLLIFGVQTMPEYLFTKFKDLIRNEALLPINSKLPDLQTEDEIEPEKELRDEVQ
jgi:hypothetical protein